MNPYDVLGVKRDASEKEIKKAYRDLCKEYHPDKGGDPEKFKEIGAAYEILSDSNKKQNYDTFGDAKGRPFDPFDGGFGGFNVNTDFDFLSQIFGNGKRQKRGNDEVVAVKLTLSEIMTGTKKDITYSRNVKCTTCKGSGGENIKKCNKCHGSGSLFTEHRTPFGMMQQQVPCDSCQDGQIIEKPCVKCNGSGVTRITETMTIGIPAGVSAGHLPINGAGNEIKNGVTGNLVIKIIEIPEPNFTRDGNNLHTEMWISIAEAVLGTEKTVKTPVSTFKFAIEPGCDSGKVFNFNGRGIPNTAPDGRNYGSGNLYVKVNVTIPKKLSDKEKVIFENLKKLDA